MTYLIRISIICLLFSTVFVVSNSFPDAMNAPKWYYGMAFLIIVGLLYAIYSLFILRKNIKVNYLQFTENTTCIVCGLQSVLFLLQIVNVIPKYGEFSVGSFGNVAGCASCLCLSLPLGWRFVKNYDVVFKIFFYLFKFLCLLAILLSGSRTGTLCALLVMALMFLPKIRKSLIFISPMLFIVAISCFKIGSSHGRWFILQRTGEMIAQHPFFGWGQGGFEAHYMDVQADFFQQHTNSEYALLADNIRHPLNEFLNIAVCYGIVGLLVIAVFVAMTVCYALLHRSETTVTGLLLLLVLGMFSLFSYPFSYPFTWLMFGFALICIYHDRLQLLKKKTSCCLIVILPVVGLQLADRCCRSLELRKIQDRASYGLSRRMLPRYASLYPHMKDDFRFLYSYAFTLYEAGNYVDALGMEKECNVLLADYDLSLLMGDTYRALGQRDSTLHYYYRAHLMCPSRLIPQYEMFCVYRESNDTIHCLHLQREILCKPIKVKSRETDDMLDEVKEYFP